MADHLIEHDGVGSLDQGAVEAARLDLPELLVIAEGRHTYAGIGIAAGLNPKALSTYLGHATITITLDRYGHLMPGSEVEARAMLDAYLDQPGP